MSGRGGISKKVVGGNVTEIWDGFVPEECKPNHKIIRFNAAQKWEEAHEPLNYGIDCLSSCGLGPGMAFANEILKKDSNFGVIGLVPCARGGTGLYRWNRGSYAYDDLIKRTKLALKDGGIIRGLLWYHGEGDIRTNNGSSSYKIKFEKFVNDLRSDLNSPNLPILLAILPYPKKPFEGPYIEVVRAAQLEINISNVIKFDAEGLEIGSDGIHLTTPAQIQLGQSNMAGRGGVIKKIVGGNITKVWNGFVPQECKPNHKIIRLNVAQKWEEAHEPLNYGIDCLTSCGLGPGMAFANEILKKDSNFGVIGLVPCARGGTSLDKWRSGTHPYDELVKRAKNAEKSGGIIRGLLWYHGESDVKGGNGYKHYKINLEKFIHDFRSDLNSSNLPIFQVILPYPKKPFKGPYIEEVRAAQLAINISNVIKIDAKGLEIGPDGIHLTTSAQVQLGHILT
ncbi:hypothetical protein KY285_021431 [Solanum tuberosum]|nr:hypothetical protein KY285_021431 [Solanum tuberosum]